MQTELLDAPTTEATVASKYGITKAAIEQAVEETKSITVTGPDDKAGIALARTSRISLGKIRTTIESKRKELKADALAYGRKVDEVAKELTAIVEPEEDRLRELEETAKREQERLAKIADESRAVEVQRRQQLAFSVRWQIQPVMLNMLSPVEFEAAYAAEKEKFDAAVKAEADAAATIKAEQERQAKIAKEQAERQAEMDRKEAELAAKQKAIDDAEKAARNTLFANRAKELSLVGRITPPEQRESLVSMSDDGFLALLESSRVAFEAEKAAKAERDRLRKEQEAKELEARIAAKAKEQAAKIEADRLAEEERKRVAAEKAEAAAKRKAARAPDREKMAAFAERFSNLEWPTLSPNSGTAQGELGTLRDLVIERLQEIADSLE